MRLTALLGLAGVLWLVGCGMLGGGVETRAAQYYNYTAGFTPKTNYTSFTSPAYRAGVSKENLNKQDTSRQLATKANTRFREVKRENVIASRDGRFAITKVEDQLGQPYSQQPPVRWVKDGMKWYLFIGAQTEIVRYGEFPSGLTLPSPEPAAEQAGEQDGADEQSP